MALKSTESVADNQGLGAETGLSLSIPSYLGLALRAGIGIAIVTFLLWRYDARLILQILAREKTYYFVGAVGLYMSTQVISAYRWQMLAGVLQFDGPFTRFLALRLVATFVNTLIPGVFGGDAVRAIYLGSERSRLGPAVASVFADRIVGLVGLFWLAAIAAILFNDARLSAAVIGPPVAIGFIALAGFLASPLIIAVLRRMPRRLSRYSTSVVSYLDHRKALVIPLALSMTVQSMLALCQYLLALGIGVDSTLSVFLFCVPIAGVFASLPVTVNGLGFREGAYLVLLGMAGVNRADAIALGLLWFACTTLGALPGVIAFAAIRLPLAPGGRARVGTIISSR